MTGLKLTLKSGTVPSGRIDLTGITPDRLAGLTRPEVLALPVGVDCRRCLLGDLFELEDWSGKGTPEEELEISGTNPLFDGIGAGMRRGRLTVHGDCGAGLALGMAGGDVIVHGSCGPFAAAEMTGGHVLIEGDAGGCLGAPRAGERVGMAGGQVLVLGNAGDRAGERMRRGAIVIQGRAGDYCGTRMIAGTVAVGQGCGDAAGFGMARGTLLLGRAPERIAAGFVDTGHHDLVFLRLARRLGGWLERIGDKTRVHRHAGDMGWRGKGEILVLE